MEKFERTKEHIFIKATVLKLKNYTFGQYGYKFLFILSL